VRVDFIICNNQPYMLEVNTVPGMSPRSIIPQQIKVAGMTVSKVYKEIIEDMIALEK
jgi:D-alanine-D-alanine ligase